jgi:hypothetical protein
MVFFMGAMALVCWHRLWWKQCRRWSYWSFDPSKKRTMNKAEHEALSAGAWKPTKHTEST